MASATTVNNAPQVSSVAWYDSCWASTKDALSTGVEKVKNFGLYILAGLSQLWTWASNLVLNNLPAVGGFALGVGAAIASFFAIRHFFPGTFAQLEIKDAAKNQEKQLEKDKNELRQTEEDLKENVEHLVDKSKDVHTDVHNTNVTKMAKNLQKKKENQ